MKLTYDPKHNIAYIRLQKKGKGVEAIQVSDELNIDVAPDGTVYGIELLNANEQHANWPTSNKSCQKFRCRYHTDSTLNKVHVTSVHDLITKRDFEFVPKVEKARGNLRIAIQNTVKYFV